MGLGGSVWHASICRRDSNMDAALKSGRRALQGVGDPENEWVIEGGETRHGKVLHVRRRTVPKEEALVGPVRDVRGTFEALKRVREVSEANGIAVSILMSMENQATEVIA